jgi:hypothetical protein
MNAEGWYVDPFGAHEARWFSDGTPTVLVRDGSEESHDQPPEATFDGLLTPIAGGQGSDGTDMMRADAAGQQSEPVDTTQGAWDAFALPNSYLMIQAI